jgi:hypothetical protein
MPRPHKERQENMRFAAFALTAIACLPAAAADAGESRPLAEKDIAAFVSVWPAMSMDLATADPEYDPELINGLRQQLDEMAASDSKDSALDRIVASDGYADFETMAALAGRILLAAQWAKDAPDQADLNAAIAGVEADTVRTASEKADLIRALKEGFERALAERPSDADIETVRPFIGALDKAVGIDG